MSSRKVDTRFRKLSEELAQRSTRRSFLFRLTASLGLFGASGVLLPVNRVPAAQAPQPCNTGNCCKAHGIHGGNRCKRLSNDSSRDDYWLFADMQGKPCSRGCCGARATFGGCPASVTDYGGRTKAVALGGCWLSNILDCDGNVHCVAYVDCCLDASYADAAVPTHIGTVVPCEEDCRRLPHGRGTSWCNLARVEPVPGSSTGFQCVATPADGPQRKAWALCTYAKDIHVGACSAGANYDNVARQRQC